MTREELIKVADDCISNPTTCNGCELEGDCSCGVTLIKLLADELKKKSPEEET